MVTLSIREVEDDIVDYSTIIIKVEDGIET